ncbi:hypothetical protein M0802_010864 [Mischocyttarus mexicanus]|nr:hypothetical protein M0802_010864 [Mischocyttarus mexicanus]
MTLSWRNVKQNLGWLIGWYTYSTTEENTYTFGTENDSVIFIGCGGSYWICRNPDHSKFKVTFPKKEQNLFANTEKKKKKKKKSYEVNPFVKSQTIRCAIAATKPSTSEQASKQASNSPIYLHYSNTPIHSPILKME